MSDQAAILLVDDREENLLALEAVLEPLGHRLARASSGVGALRELLLHEFACILLDVDMPELDGFETARLIKGRGRSANVPIVFVTALPEDDEQVFEGYAVGAVDYIFKPINPAILRSKVGVFVELWEKNHRLREQELLALERANETRYGQLADAMPQIVWRADVDGKPTYFNRRWFEYTGMTPVEAEAKPWSAVHAEDREDLLAKLAAGEPFEHEFRFRASDGTHRWHLARTAPIRDESDRVESWVGTATDIHDRKRAEEQWSFLLEAGDTLAGSLDYRETLAQVAQLAVGKVADWCTVHVAEGGAVAQVAVAHRDPAQVAFARELQERYPPDPDSPTGPAAVIRTGEAELVRDISDTMIEHAARDQLHLDLLRQLEFASYMCAHSVRSRSSRRTRAAASERRISCSPRSSRAARRRRSRTRTCTGRRKSARRRRARSRPSATGWCCSTEAGWCGYGTPPRRASPAWPSRKWSATAWRARSRGGRTSPRASRRPVPGSGPRWRACRSTSAAGKSGCRCRLWGSRTASCTRSAT
ncbi:MAG: response regulator [Actinobacteria bacterium]|nr:MAG: response regulator [Actinomycetota bacterium]